MQSPTPCVLEEAVQRLYVRYRAGCRCAIDSRADVEGALFFALQGENFNGNAFAKEALEKGAVCAVVDQESYWKPDGRYLLVSDVLSVLQDLARWHRAQLQVPVVAITGSSGKTTTKELTKAVLQTRYTVHATSGNLNNCIGVPLTILATPPNTDVIVLEMGASAVGEIEHLCRIAQPTHGLVTNVAKVHLAGFGSLEGIVAGKAELYRYLFDTQGVAFVNTDQKLLMRAVPNFEKLRSYPNPQDYYPCALIDAEPTLTCRVGGGDTLHTTLVGAYNFYNIAAALCIGKHFAVPPHKAHAAVEAFQPPQNRSQVIQVGTNTVLLDAYNANLVSMQGAIEALISMKAKHYVLMLGDMNELGDETEAAHSALGRFTRGLSSCTTLLCGMHMKFAADANPSAHYFPHKAALTQYLTQHRHTHAAVLIKGSRALRMETLLDVLRFE